MTHTAIRFAATILLAGILFGVLLTQTPALASSVPSESSSFQVQEPNDDFDTATNISLPTEKFNLETSYNDTDFYAISLQPGIQVTVSVGFTHADGDIDLYIADPNRDRIQSNTSDTDDESITFTPGMSGTYYIVVVGWADTPTPYSLTVTGDQQPSPANDDLEYNNGFSTATNITTPYDRDELRITPSDTDVFAVQVPADHRVTITTLFNHSHADIDLHVYNATQDLLRVGYSHTDNETVTLSTDDQTTIYIEVASDQANAAYYTLTVTSQPLSKITTTTEITTTTTTAPSTTTGAEGPGFTLALTLLTLTILTTVSWITRR